ncbi:MAG: four helix bundle protein [Planctomycetota bacterium]
MDSKGYRSLLVWERGMELVEEVYRLTDRMPTDERFGLVSQMQRSAISIPSNIAEGYSRSHGGDYLKHLSYARGSLAELETQLIAAVRVKRIEREHAVPCWELCQEVGKMLTGLIKKVAEGRHSS